MENIISILDSGGESAEMSNAGVGPLGPGDKEIFEHETVRAEV